MGFEEKDPALGVTFPGGDVYYKSDFVKRITDDDLRLNMTMRAEFDHALVKRAQEKGVAFIDNTTATAIDARKGLVKIGDRHCKADFIVGADGIPSFVANQVNLSRKPGSDISKEAAIGYEAHLSLDDFGNTDVLKLPRLYFGIVNFGYAWTFPKKNHLTIGIGGLKHKNGKMKNLFSSFLDYFGLDIEDIHYKGHSIPYGQPKTKIATGKCFLVGDAAGIADPLIGEGIYYGLKNGEILAEAVHKGSSHTDIISSYHKRVKREIYGDLKYALRLRNIIFKKRITPLSMKSIQASEPLATDTMRLVSGDRSEAKGLQ